MPTLRSRRVTALLTIGALSAGTAVAASPAQAGLLDGVLPNVGSLVTGTGATLGGVVNGVLPGTGGVITGVTGTVGGVIGGVQDTVAGTLDETLGGILGGGGGLLPDDVLGSLLGTLLANSSAAPGTPGLGGPNAGGPIVLSGGTLGPNGQISLDASAPRSTVTVLSKLKQVGKTGKMKLRITTNEPGVVALKSTVRPGATIKAKKGAKAAKVSKKLIKIRQIVLGYRKAGKLDVTVKLSRAAQRSLGKVKDAKMSVGTIAVDVWKNQDSENTKLKIKR
jgi:hypothetical protein